MPQATTAALASVPAASALSTLTNILAAPSQAYEALKRNPTVWFPLLLIVVGWAGLWFWYYHAVDFNWLLNSIIASQARDASPEQRDAIGRTIAKLTPNVLAVITLVTALAVALLRAGVMAVYLRIISALGEDALPLKGWFSFTLWASVPFVFSILAMIANFALSGNGHLGPEQLNPLSLNNLVFHVSPGSGYTRLANSVDLMTFWSVGLMVVGYRQWTGKSWGSSAAFILLPQIVVYGAWFALSSQG